MVMLTWRTIVSSRDPKYTVKGTELACAAVPNTMHRFAVYEVRTLEADGGLGVKYRIRDAQTVTDSEVRAGVRPRIVFENLLEDECLHWCEENK